MISCKICHQKFKKPSKFYEHLHSNKCKIPTMDQNIKNANKMLKLCKNRNYDEINEEILKNKENKKIEKDLILRNESNIFNKNNNELVINNNELVKNNNELVINNNELIKNNNKITKYNNNGMYFECKYCNKPYKHKSSLSRHVKNCQDKKALEHLLGEKLRKQNMTLEEFIELRNSKQLNAQIFNNNHCNHHYNFNKDSHNNINNNNNIITNNNTIMNTNNTINNNIQINMINPFGNENVEHILNNKELCMNILKKMDNGVNKLFLEVYNKDENRNFYKVDKKNKIATLTKENRINHNDYTYITEQIFNRMHNLYNKISENLKNICDDKIKDCIVKNMNYYNRSGLKFSNKKTFDDYMDYMSKMNEELITNMLIDNGIITEKGIPMLDVT